MSIPEGLFHNSKEQVKGILGESYLPSFISGEGISRSSMVLSDRRIYQMGKAYQIKNTGGGLRLTKSKNVVPLSAVTGTSVTTRTYTMLLILGILFLLIGVVLLPAIEASGGFGGLMMVLGVVFIIAAFVKKEQIFEVDYKGGSVQVPCKWFSNADIEAFQKAISLEIDRWHYQD